jgi:uncharacterized protein YndB with AHSA1/START domain
MWKKLAIGLVAIVALLAIVVALQAGEFRVARAITIAAPAQKVFAEVNSMRRWQPWSPYEKLDPAMKRSYEGPEAGQGSVYTWSGNSQAGEGRATIVESKPNEKIRIRLDFQKPFAATSFATFTFKPQGSTTSVEWALEGDKNFVAKALHLVMDMDKMVGGQFEEGLGNLRKVAETKS